VRARPLTLGSAASVAWWWRRADPAGVGEAEVRVAGSAPGQARGEHGCGCRDSRGSPRWSSRGVRAGSARPTGRCCPCTRPARPGIACPGWGSQSLPRCRARWRPPAAAGHPAGDGGGPARQNRPIWAEPLSWKYPNATRAESALGRPPGTSWRACDGWPAWDASDPLRLLSGKDAALGVWLWRFWWRALVIRGSLGMAEAGGRSRRCGCGAC